MVLQYKPIQFRTVDAFNVHRQGILREVVVGAGMEGLLMVAFRGTLPARPD